MILAENFCRQCKPILAGQFAHAVRSVPAQFHFDTLKILKFGTPQTIAIIVLKIEKFDVTLH